MRRARSLAGHQWPSYPSYTKAGFAPAGAVESALLFPTQERQRLAKLVYRAYLKARPRGRKGPIRRRPIYLECLG